MKARSQNAPVCRKQFLPRAQSTQKRYESNAVSELRGEKTTTEPIWAEAASFAPSNASESNASLPSTDSSSSGFMVSVRRGCASTFTTSMVLLTVVKV